MPSSPREEAQRQIGDAFFARVLEPSPPAVAREPWFADDPVNEPGDGRPVVSPVGNGDLRYEDVPGIDPQWCAERWLGFHRRLRPVGDMFAATRLSLHALAEQVLRPARERVNGKIGLRFTRGGFGTPFFGDDEQLRVEGDRLIASGGAAPLTTLVAAGELAGVAVAEDRPLEVDAHAAAQLGDLYGFAASVLEELRASAGEELEPSRVQLWPEHFDMAVELGSESGGVRAGYGISPGDELHPEPYAYVVPWTAKPAGELWQAGGFTGAELPYAELLAASDQRAVALGFFRSRLAALTERTS